MRLTHQTRLPSRTACTNTCRKEFAESMTLAASQPPAYQPIIVNFVPGYDAEGPFRKILYRADHSLERVLSATRSAPAPRLSHWSHEAFTASFYPCSSAVQRECASFKSSRGRVTSSYYKCITTQAVAFPGKAHCHHRFLGIVCSAKASRCAGRLPCTVFPCSDC